MSRDTLVDRQKPEPPWRQEGWCALLSARVSHGVERSGIRGDWDGRFVDLALPAGTKIDRESPVLIRTAFPDPARSHVSRVRSLLHPPDLRGGI